jgi:hypothetical protein
MVKKRGGTNRDVHGVFRLKPIKGTNSAQLKCVGHVNGTDQIPDEPLICNAIKSERTSSAGSDGSDGSGSGNDDRYVYKITDSIYARFYHCNIRDSYLMMTKTLPVLYASIMYQTDVICGLLFNIFIDFAISTDVKTEKQLVGTVLEGRFQLRIKASEKDKDKTIDLDIFDGNEFMINMMKAVIETDEMKAVIAKLMEERRKERVEKMGSVDDIEIPKPRYNFTKLVKQYRQNGKIEI